MKVTNDDSEIESLYLRYEITIDRYRNKVISLWRAAETAGLTIEEFKELLSSRGMKVEVSSSDEESDIRLKKVFHGR